MVRSISLLAVIIALTSGVWSAVQSPAQEQSPNVTNSSPSSVLELAQGEPKPKARKAPAGRIPNGWGKLNLSPEQKKNIYEIQAKYKKQVEDLELQIEELKTKQLEDMEGVLTADQLSKLKAQSKSTKGEASEEKSDSK